MKTIFTRWRVTAIIFCIFFVLLASSFPVYCVNSLAVRFSSARNKTVVGLVFRQDREQVEALNFAINSVSVQFMAFLTILVSTITLVAQLRRKAHWRQKTVAPGQCQTVSNRDQRVAKMVLLLSSLFIACFIPACFIIIGIIIEPEFSFGGKYHNLFIITSSLAFVFESTNSSMNIFIYYHMSSKYRSVLQEKICKRAQN